MKSPPKPDDEAERLESLRRMNLLSTPREPELDRITRIAQYAFDTEIALISLIDEDRQWFKARRGLDVTETPRDISFCGHAIWEAGPLVVEDASDDPRFCDNPLVTGGPEIRFYAGQPLDNAEGYRIGTLCIISPQPRPFSEEDREVLIDLARLAELVLENRTLSQAQIELVERLSTAERDRMIDSLTGLWNRRGLAELFPHEAAKTTRDGTPIGVALVDIDYFKRINDSFGHDIGDQALELTARLLSEAARGSDVVARYGGEEFALLLPGAGPDDLPAVGKKIVKTFRKRARLDTGQGIHTFTASCGLAAVPPEPGVEPSLNALVADADRALYAAKGAGRNRFMLASAA